MVQKVEIRDPAELVQAAMQPAPSAVFSLFRVNEDGSRYEYPVRVQLMRNEDALQILEAAQQDAKKRNEDPSRYTSIYSEAQGIHLVARALCKVEGPEERDDGSRFWRRLFVSPEHLRTAFTENEIAYLINCYEIVRAKYSVFDDFDPARIDDWAAKLGDQFKGNYFLAQLDSTQWPAALTCLARRVCELLESQSPPPETSPESAESESTSSSHATTGSTTPISGTLSGSDAQIPNGRSLSWEEARRIANQVKDRAAQKDGDGEPE